MKTSLKNIGEGMVDALEQDIAEDLMAVPGRERKSLMPILVEGLLIAILIAVCVFLFSGFLSDGTSAALSAFQTTKEKIATSIEQEQYQMGYDWAKEEYKVTNQLSITVGELQEKANLEVLRVSEISYRIESKDSKTGIAVLASVANLLPGNGEIMDSWIAVPGSGVFTINLKASEFIIDEKREYILIRVPKPIMTQFKLNTKGIEILEFDETGKASAKKGNDLVRKQLEDAQFDIRQSIAGKEQYEKAAKDSATRILTNIVKALNPQVKNLTVEVEFVE